MDFESKLMNIEISEYLKKEVLLGNVCRICLHLEKCDNLADILETSFSEIFEFVTQIKVQDEQGFPKKICNNCKCQVLLSNELKLKVQSSTQVIAELVKAAKAELNKLFKCSMCSKLFKYESTKLRHERTHEPQYKCPKCSRTFGFQSSLKRHLKLHARETSECPYCSKVYKDATLLSRHIKLVHQVKGFKCGDCGSAFGSASSLRSHRVTHTPAAARRYRCPHLHCGKTFNFQHHLDNHASTHTGRKKYFCDLCNAGFIQSHHLVSHLKRHQPALWLPCPAPGCQKKLPDKYALRRHLRCHDERKSLMCTECGKCLSSMRSLKDHSLKCQSKLTNEATKARSKSKGSADKKLSCNRRSNIRSSNADSSINITGLDKAESLITSEICVKNYQPASNLESSVGETVNMNACDYNQSSNTKSTGSQVAETVIATGKRVLMEPRFTELGITGSVTSGALNANKELVDQESNNNSNNCGINCCMLRDEVRNNNTVVSANENLKAIGCCRETVITQSLDSIKTEECVQKNNDNVHKLKQRKTKINLSNIIMYKDVNYKRQLSGDVVNSENVLENIVETASTHASHMSSDITQRTSIDQTVDKHLNQPSREDGSSNSVSQVQVTPSMCVKSSSTFKQFEINNRIQTSDLQNSNSGNKDIKFEIPTSFIKENEQRRNTGREITNKDESESSAVPLEREIHQKVTKSNEGSQQIGKSIVSRRLGVSNTCKTIFGNCLVSGTSAPSEDCLCAKMNEDDPVPEFLTPPLVIALEKQGLYST